MRTRKAAIPSVAVTSDGTVGVFYYTFDGFSQDNMPIFSAHLAESSDQGVTFSHQTLLTFLSSAADNGNSRQRVLGDYMQMKAVGGCFYGASREMASLLVDLLPTTTQSSSESALLHLQGPLQRQGPARRQRRVQRPPR
jgi:hypothetical protein